MDGVRLWYMKTWKQLKVPQQNLAQRGPVTSVLWITCRNDVEESKRWHKEMLGYSETLLQRLNLPYRVINCCTGDLGEIVATSVDLVRSGFAPLT